MLTYIKIDLRIKEVFSRHFIKEGSVWLYRLLILLDKQIMKIIWKKCYIAYVNWCAAYGDCAPHSLSYFISIDGYVNNTRNTNFGK